MLVSTGSHTGHCLLGPSCSGCLPASACGIPVLLLLKGHTSCECLEHKFLDAAPGSSDLRRMLVALKSWGCPIIQYARGGWVLVEEVCRRREAASNVPSSRPCAVPVL